MLLSSRRIQCRTKLQLNGQAMTRPGFVRSSLNSPACPDPDCDPSVFESVLNCSPSQGQNKVTHSASMDSCRLSGTGNTRSARALPDPTGIDRYYSSPSSRRLTAAHPQSTSNLESSPPTRPSYVRKSSPAARCPSNFPSATLTAAGYCFSRAE